MGAASAHSCYCEESEFHTKYALGKMLGKGSQGRVYVCVSKGTGHTRAVKIIDRSWRTAWATYRREVDLCRAASASNVVEVIEEFVDSGYCYVVMEKFEGHLRKGLKWVAKEEGCAKSPLGEGCLRRVVWQTLTAINHLHTHGIIHRDVKSHNLLIDRLDLRDLGCRVVLGDFGLARRLEAGRVLGSQVGTRKYWAPELYEKRYWHVADVFAVGVLIFLATCSTYPFMDEEQTRTRDLWKEGAVPRALGAEGQEFLRLVLEKDPTLRPTAGQAMEHAWLAAASEPEPGPGHKPRAHRGSFGPRLLSRRDGPGSPPPPPNLVGYADDGPAGARRARRALESGPAEGSLVEGAAEFWSSDEDTLLEGTADGRRAGEDDDGKGPADATPSTQAVPWSSPSAIHESDGGSPAPWAPQDEGPAERGWSLGAPCHAQLVLDPL